MGTAADDRTAHKRAGQFYTPPEVARFLVELLGVVAPQLGSPASVIDPACGQGVFLEAAVQVLADPPRRVVGVDLFPHEAGIWADDAAVTADRQVGDGLLLPDGELFDLVTGNPPFHGEALRCLVDPDDSRASALASALQEGYELWRRALREPRPARSQLAFPGTEPPASPLSARTLDQLSRYPLELMFLDRFVHLCRPGGHVVIVLPEGVVANRRLQYVRDWVQETCHLLAVVRLPRGTFRKSGTSAVTTTLLLQRRAPGSAGGLRTLLLDVERLDRLDGLLADVRAGHPGEAP
jgi:hypothetical protein